MIRKQIIFLLFAAAAGSVAAQETPSSPPHDRLESGRQFYNAEEWGRLLPLARQWTETLPKEWLGWFYFAAALEGEREDLNNALKYYRKAWALSDKTDARPQIKIGDIHSRQKNFEEAERSYRLALLRNEQMPFVWEKLLAAVQAGSQRDKDVVALAVIKRVMRFAEFQNRYHLWRQYAQMLDRAGERTAARRAYYRALSMRRYDVPSWQRLFVLAREENKTTEMKKIADIILGYERDNPVINTYLGVNAYRAGHKRAAKKYFEGVLKNGESSPEDQVTSLLRLGDLASTDSPTRALQYYKQALSVIPEKLEIWERVVVALKGLGLHEQSQQYFLRMQQVEKLVSEGKPITPELLII